MGLPWEDDDGGWSPAKTVGGVAGVMAGGGPVGAYVGSKIAPGVQSAASKAVGWDRSKQKDLAEQSGRLSDQEINDRQGVLDQMSAADRQYSANYGSRMDEYLGKSQKSGMTYRDTLARNQQQARDQATNAQTTYTNDIQPRLKSTMEDAQRQAGSAMSLADAGDPNNSVHKAVRGMYDEQAQGVGKQGVADYGVLSALGAQATQNTMGAGGPMTGAQMQLSQAQNQQAASRAYAISRQRMDALKQQGIDRGFEQSNAQYNRGQDAKDRYERSIGNYEGGMDRNIARQGRFRDEDTGYGQGIMGVERGLAQEEFQGRDSVDSLNRQNAYGQSNRALSQLDARYGNQQSQIANQMAQANAENAARSGMFGGILQAGAAGAGAYFGGAQGAQTGASIAGPVAQSMGG